MDAMEPWEHPGTQVGVLIVSVSREEIEAGDTRHVSETLRKLLNPEVANRTKGRLFLIINGYDDDPRDLWEFSDVCAWMKAVDKDFPYWFYFMDLGPHSTLALIAFTLCKYQKVPAGKQIPYDELMQFLRPRLKAWPSLPTTSARPQQRIAVARWIS
jgi:hypothetical protein